MVVEYKSGPQGKAAVNSRVAEANARIAAALCDCAVCEEAAVRVRSRVRATAVTGHQGTAVESSLSAKAKETTWAAGPRLRAVECGTGGS